MYLLVKIALYGHPAAPIARFNHFSASLKRQGYTAMVYDLCVFVKRVNGHVSYILLQVDDLFVGETCHTITDELEAMLKREYHKTCPLTFDTAL